LLIINICGESGTVRHTQNVLKFAQKRIFFKMVSKKSPSFSDIMIFVPIENTFKQENVIAEVLTKKIKNPTQP